MQRYSENCVRAPQASRGLAGAREACCCARAGDGVGAGGCATAAGSAGAAVTAADCAVGLGLAGDAGGEALGGDPAAGVSIGVRFAPPGSAAIGALAGDAGPVGEDRKSVV